VRRLLLLLTAVCLSGCNLDVAQPANDPSDPATETFSPSLGIDLSTMTKTADGVYYKDLIVGAGTSLSGLPYIEFTFAGFVKSGASFAAGQEDTPVLLGSEIPGLQEGMQGMRIGGQRLIVIPSALGFGAINNGSVPANSTLIFEIQLDDIPQ
jgi:FKBP-type peptidyl-prolyl cis-trans isomerase